MLNTQRCFKYGSGQESNGRSHLRGNKDVLGDIGVRPRGLESLSPGRVLPLGMRHHSNPQLLNCTKDGLRDPGRGLRGEC
jgi:hypothetical protein